MDDGPIRTPGADDDGLPVWPTASGALRFGFSVVGAAALAGVLESTLMTAMIAAGWGETSGGGGTESGVVAELGPASDITLLIVSFALTAVFTVYFHRVVMVGAVSRVRIGAGPREWRFLLATLLFSVCLFLPAAVVAFAGGLTFGAVLPAGVIALVVAVGAAVLFLFVRFALAFPAIAVDAPGSLVDQFRFSFIATRGRFGRLFAVYAVAYLLFLAIAVLVGTVLAAVLSGVAAGGVPPLGLIWLGLTVQVTLQFVALAMFASIASRAFMAWSGWKPASAVSSPPSA